MPVEDTLPAPSVWLLTWGLAAALVAGTAAVIALRHLLRSPNLDVFDLHVQRLLSANNRPRAIALAQVLPGDPMLALLHFALTQTLRDAPRTEATGGYRDGAHAAPFEQRALDHLRAEADRLGAPFVQTTTRLSMALAALSATGIALALLGPDTAYRAHVLIGSGALGLGLAVLLWLRTRRRNILHEAAQRWARFVLPA